MDDRLAYWAAENPDGEAITYGPRTFTWAQWDDRVRRAAGGLRALGIGRGDIVSFLDKNHPACVEISMAAGSLGAANRASRSGSSTPSPWPTSPSASTARSGSRPRS